MQTSPHITYHYYRHRIIRLRPGHISGIRSMLLQIKFCLLLRKKQTTTWGNPMTQGSLPTWWVKKTARATPISNQMGTLCWILNLFRLVSIVWRRHQVVTKARWVKRLMMPITWLTIALWQNTLQLSTKTGAHGQPRRGGRSSASG